MLSQCLTRLISVVLLVVGVNATAVAHEALPHVHTEYWNSAVVVVLILVFAAVGNKIFK